MIKENKTTEISKQSKIENDKKWTGMRYLQYVNGCLKHAELCF